MRFWWRVWSVQGSQRTRPWMALWRSGSLRPAWAVTPAKV